jgi:hypothetical protein
MPDQPRPEPLRVEPDVLRDALGEGDPDDVERKHQRTVLREGRVDRGEQRVGMPARRPATPQASPGCSTPSARHSPTASATGQLSLANECWTLNRSSLELPIVARRLADLLFLVLDHGPDVPLPSLGTIGELHEEQRRAYLRTEEARSRTPPAVTSR